MDNLSAKSKHTILNVISSLNSANYEHLILYCDKLGLFINDLDFLDKSEPEKMLLLQYEIMLAVSDNIENCYKLFSLSLSK